MITNLSSFLSTRLCYAGLLCLGPYFPQALAQTAPTVSSLAPLRNAVAVRRPVSAAVVFSEAMEATTLSSANLPTFSAQRGGQKAGTFAGGNTATVSFQPAIKFTAGETISRTLTTSLRSVAGGALAKPLVYQFTTDAAPAAGTFAAGATDVAIGSSPAGVAAVDLNNDGMLDIATADRGGTIGFSFGDGTGQFSGLVNLGVGGTSLDIIAADLNGDGYMDLLAPRVRSNSLSLILNDGVTGQFSYTVTEIYADQDARFVKAADIDGDGDLDLLVTCYSGSVAVLFNDGRGHFRAGSSVALPTAYGIATGDIDNDGDVDFIATNYAGNTTTAYLNNGKGVFTPGSTSTVGSGPIRAALGDVNGDGYLDALTANLGSGTVSVALNTGTGTFGTPATVAAPHAADVELGDVDGDGDLDFIASDYSYGVGVSVRLNDGKGAFSGTSSITVAGVATSGNTLTNNNPFGVALADMDNNGTLDLVATTFSGLVSVRLNAFTPATLTSTTSAVCSGVNAGSLAFSHSYGAFQTYQANAGSGFREVVGSGPTLPFSNLTATTSYRAVFQTPEGQTVYSTVATVVVNPLPIARIQADGPTTFCQGGLVRLTASGGASYLWSTGATTAAITVATSGSYSVVATSAAGCASSSVATTVTVSPVPAASLRADGPTLFCQGSTVKLLAAGGKLGSTYRFLRNNVLIAGTTDSTYVASAAGTYAVVITNSLGCGTTSAPLEVRVNLVPATPTLTASTANGLTTLTSSAPTGNQFYLNGTAIAGATSQTYSLNAPLPAGAYTVVTTTAEGCSSQPSATFAVVLAVRQPTSSALSLYPNPAFGDVVTVELRGYSKPVDLTLYSILGQPVRSVSLPAGSGSLHSYPLSVASLPAGIYILQSKSDGQSTTQRLVKE